VPRINFWYPAKLETDGKRINHLWVLLFTNSLRREEGRKEEKEEGASKEIE
jgi:hypothetical protein